LSSTKFRDLVVVFWVGLFVLTWQPVFIWLLIGSVVLLQPSKKVGRKKEFDKDRHRRIRQDANEFGLEMPRKPVLRSLLRQVYIGHEKSIKRYPHLQNEYDEVLNDMWQSLAMEQSSEHWEKTLHLVLSGWPKSEGSSSRTIQDSLQRVRDLSQKWDEAKNEAMGGSRV
jgi:hypothetical protein